MKQTPQPKAITPTAKATPDTEHGMRRREFGELLRRVVGEDDP